ncbi:MAG: hypothetical protein JSV96_02705, partial [Candidatus Aminicenantes bacterium]
RQRYFGKLLDYFNQKREIPTHSIANRLIPPLSSLRGMDEIPHFARNRQRIAAPFGLAMTP